MFDRIFANYLVSQQKFDPEHLEEIFKLQDQKRVRLGVIAVSEKLMTDEQVEEVNTLQSQSDKRFGDIAVEKGYITDSQVTRLLALQGNGFLAFVQSVIDLGLLSMNDIVESLNKFQRDCSYTITDMENLKSCDLDRIIPIYVYDLPDYAKEIIGVAIRTLSRLIDYHIYIDKPYVSDKLTAENICNQESKGDINVLLSISGDESALMTTAIKFADASIVEELEDALDTTCEIINCINGLFATDLSKRNVVIDMLAPSYKLGTGSISSDEIINVPIYMNNEKITLSVVLSDNFTIE